MPTIPARNLPARHGYIKVLASGVLLSLLAGCAVGPAIEPIAPAVPADWSSWHGGSETLLKPQLRRVTAAATAGRWWESFNDPVLNDLQARALAANQDLQVAALRFAQSRVQRQMVAAQRGVQLGGSGGVSRQRQSKHGGSARTIGAIVSTNQDAVLSALSAPHNLFQAGFDASWELDLWGRVSRSIEAADASIRAAAAYFDDIRLALLAEVARNYFELRGVQQQQRLIQADLVAAEEMLELTRAHAADGLVSDLDVLRQSAQLAELRARWPLLLAQEAETINRLSGLLGAQPGALQASLQPVNPKQLLELPDLSLGLPAKVAQRRPDIRQAEARLQVATAGIGIAVADLYPRIILGARFGFESTDGAKFGEWGSRQWAVGSDFSVPLFDRGRRHSTIVLRTLEQQEAAVAYQQTVLHAWHEIDTALSAYAAEQQRYRDLLEQVQHSRAAHELARHYYRNGATSFLDALSAQRTLLRAEQELNDSHSRLAVLLIAIHKTLGGDIDWEHS